MDEYLGKYGYGRTQRLDTTVEYPLELDMSQYIDGPDKVNPIYSLYAVSV